MSDDEYYDDDFWDDDWMFIDEGDPDLADDLAYGTSHSPVFFDDEVLYDIYEDTDSDWEYYDETYDADPAGLRKRGTDTGKPALKRTAGDDDDRQAKRRMVEGDDKKILDRITNVDPTTFCGVVWRAPSHTDAPPPRFQPEKAEQVALLKNWREIFKSSQPVTSGLAKSANGQPAKRKRGPQGKKPKMGKKRAVTKEDAMELDTHEDFLAEDNGVEDAQGPEVMPPTSLSPSHDAWENNRKNILSTRGRQPSRLNEVMAADDVLSEGSSAPPKPKTTTAPVYPKVEVVIPVTKKENNVRPSRETTARGRKRKASSPPPESRNEKRDEPKANGEQTSRRSVRRKVDSQTEEQKQGPPRRSARSFRGQKKK